MHEGNVRRIIVKQGDDVVVEFPLTAGVIGVVFAPMLAAVGAIAAFVTECTIEVERTDDDGHDHQAAGVASRSKDGAKLEEWMKY